MMLALRDMLIPSNVTQPFHYRVVEIIDPASLTFKLAETRQNQGLEGQDTGNNNTQRAGQEEELMPVVKGTHVFIHSGRQKGTYGVVRVAVISSFESTVCPVCTVYDRVCMYYMFNDCKCFFVVLLYSIVCMCV